MQPQDSWSVTIGRCVGVPVRLHVALLLFILWIWSIEWHFVKLSPELGGINTGTWIATAFAVLLAIVIHELGHVFAVLNLGGSVRKIVLSPWSGPSEFNLPPRLGAKAIVYLAGPFVNAMVFAMTAAMLVTLDHTTLARLIDPFHPNSLSPPFQVGCVKIFCWVNFQLFIINCIPAYPFDGSHWLRLVFLARNRSIPVHRLETAVMAVGNMVGIALIVLAFFSQRYNEGPLQPTWAVLAAGGIILIFTSRHEFFRRMADYHRAQVVENQSLEELNDFGLFYDDEYESFEFGEDHSDSVSQWLRQKQEERQLVEHEIELEENRRVDAILEKLHQSGKDSLTEDEKSVLQRVSDRLRRRRRQPSSGNS